MRKTMLKNILLITALTISVTSCAAEGERELELVSRDLFEGPARDAFLYRTSFNEDEGLILAGGGAVIVVPKGTPIEDGTTLHIDGIPMDIALVGYTAWIAAKGKGLGKWKNGMEFRGNNAVK